MSESFSLLGGSPWSSSVRPYEIITTNTPKHKSNQYPVLDSVQDSEPMNTSPVSHFNKREYLPSYLTGETHQISLAKSGTPNSPARRRMTISNVSFSSDILHGTPEKDLNQTTTKDDSIIGKQGPPISGIGRVEESNCFTSLLSSTSPGHKNLNTSTGFSLTNSPPVRAISSNKPGGPTVYIPISKDSPKLSTWVTVFGFTTSSTSNIIVHFGQFGTILESKTNPGSNWIHLKYSNTIEARRALSKNGTVICGNLMVGVISCNEEMAENGIPPGGSGIFNKSASVSFSNSRRSLRVLGQNTYIDEGGEQSTSSGQMRSLGRDTVDDLRIPKKNDGFLSWAMDIFGW